MTSRLGLPRSQMRWPPISRNVIGSRPLKTRSTSACDVVRPIVLQSFREPSVAFTLCCENGVA